MADTELPEIKLVASGPTYEVWRGAKGTARLDWTRDGSVRIIVKGHGHGDFANPEIRRWTDALRLAPKAKLVIDFWEMDSYDSKLRVLMQEWASKRTKEVEVFVLAKSKLVVMGVSVANLAVGGIIKAYSRREDFDRECRRMGFPIDPPMA